VLLQQISINEAFMDAGSPGPTPAAAQRKIGGSDQWRMTGIHSRLALFVTVAALAVALSASAHASACQASFRQMNQIGPGASTVKAVLSLFTKF
jgi:hypothetical protein